MVPNQDSMVPNSAPGGGGGGGGSGTLTPPLVDTGIVYVPGLPSTFTYTIPNGCWHVVLNGSMTLLSGTITMPSAPIDGQIIRLKTMQEIEGIVLAPNSGQHLINSPQTMAPNTYFEASYDAANSTWYVEFVADALVTLIAPLTLYVCILAGTITGGSGYTNGTYSGISLTGGSGTATADIVVAGGAVTAVNPISQSGELVGDILTATIPGGAGFQFAVTGVGNDLQTGTTQASAFRTLTRANQEIANFNWAEGFAGTVNVFNGLYNEILQLNTLVGTSENQISWVGNTAANASYVHIQPSTNPNGLAVVNFLNVVGHNFNGFWFDGLVPGFGGWDIIRPSGNSINLVQNCRWSELSNDGWDLIIMNGGILNINNNIWVDWSGNQASFATMGQGTQVIFGSNTIITSLSAPPTIGVGNDFFEIARGAFVYLNFPPSGWVGWGATTGIQASIQAGARILTLYGSGGSIPGTPDTVNFTDNVSSYGPLFDNSTNVNPGALAFGIRNANYITAFGPGTNLPSSRTFAVWGYNAGANDQGYFFLLNDIDLGGSGIVRGLSRFRHVTAASYTAVLSDLDRRIEMDNAGANTFTVPTDATIAPFGSGIPNDGGFTVVQAGAGATTIAAAVGVTLHFAAAFPGGALPGQWASARIYRRGVNEYAVTQV